MFGHVPCLLAPADRSQKGREVGDRAEIGRCDYQHFAQAVLGRSPVSEKGLKRGQSRQRIALAPVDREGSPGCVLASGDSQAGSIRGATFDQIALGERQQSPGFGIAWFHGNRLAQEIDGLLFPAGPGFAHRNPALFDQRFGLWIGPPAPMPPDARPCQARDAQTRYHQGAARNSCFVGQ